MPPHSTSIRPSMLIPPHFHWRPARITTLAYWATGTVSDTWPWISTSPSTMLAVAVAPFSCCLWITDARTWRVGSPSPDTRGTVRARGPLTVFLAGSLTADFLAADLRRGGGGTPSPLA